MTQISPNAWNNLSPTSGEIDPTDADLDKALAGGVLQDITDDPEAWNSAIRSKQRTLYKQYIGQILPPLLGRRFERSTEAVSRYYRRWSKFDLTKFDPSTNDDVVACIWRGRRLLVSISALRKVYLLRVARVIEVLKPRSICEVGFGNGINLLTLSACFPEIEFHGIELTNEGVAAAKNVIELPELPAGLAALAPIPIKDTTAHRKISVSQGDATNIRHETGRFDLVLTFAAVEQMEMQRHMALLEIARISNTAVSMIEPFQNVNDRGMRRAYVVGQNYFRGSIEGLAEYGLIPRWVSNDMPQQFNLAMAHAVSMKKPPDPIRS